VNDTCASALPIVDGTTLFDTLGATTDSITMTGCGVGFAQIPRDIWYRYTAVTNGPVVVATCGSDFDTALAVLDGTMGCPGTLPVLACNDDYDCDQLPGTLDRQSRAVFEGIQGRAYLIRVGAKTMPAATVGWWSRARGCRSAAAIGTASAA
jgi:hypothetical protein